MIPHIKQRIGYWLMFLAVKVLAMRNISRDGIVHYVDLIYAQLENRSN